MKNKYEFEYTAFEAAELARATVTIAGFHTTVYIETDNARLAGKFQCEFEVDHLTSITAPNGHKVGDGVEGYFLSVLNAKIWRPFIEQKQLPENIEKVLENGVFGCKETIVRALVDAILKEVEIKC